MINLPTSWRLNLFPEKTSTSPTVTQQFYAITLNFKVIAQILESLLALSKPKVIILTYEKHQM